MLPSYEDYEALGLVRYVDSYSRGMGDTTMDKYTTYIEEPTAHDQIMDAVEEASKAFREKHEYYRLAFRTLSTLIAYSDPTQIFRFLTRSAAGASAIGPSRSTPSRRACMGSRRSRCSAPSWTA